MFFEFLGSLFEAQGLIFEAWIAQMTPQSSKKGPWGVQGAFGTESLVLLG